MAKNQLKDGTMVLNIGKFKKLSASNSQKIKKLSASSFFQKFLIKKKRVYDQNNKKIGLPTLTLAAIDQKIF